ncbi:PAS domain S-box protein [Methylobacterium sp. NEAU 140]|uniref:hybrid sensor histidine kinase/response regulator n=1 Tax=Methylobacterium sp. NEAU 140 TaxID=3064945 RepID=UPI0027352AF2|nr:PAS domain S-box protein [Methylobacterium sp. NEAU 140]MDP4024194.1 PAS domain S-box protein [Methylobacterium sp. NEAU 140]
MTAAMTPAEIEALQARNRALEAELARQHTIVASVVDFAIVVLDREGRVTDWNAGAERVLGWAASAVLGRTATFFFTPEDRAAGRLETEMRTALARGRADDDRWHLREDGARIRAAGEMMPLREPDGTHTGFVKVLRDRTAHHRTGEALRATEAELARHEARYRTLFDAIDEGFCIIEFVDGPHGPLSDYVHVEANPAYERNTGIPDIVGRRVRDLAPAEADGWVELYGGVLRTGEPIRFERAFVLVGRIIEVAAFRIEPAERRQVAVLFRDVTERVRTRERLRLAIEATGVGIYDYNLVTGALGWDARVRALFGVAADAAVTYEGTFLPGLHPDDRNRAHAAVQAALDPDGPGRFHIAYRVRAADTGAERWLAARGQAVVAAGRTERFVGTVRDVTAEKAAEAALRATEERYRIATRATNDAIWDWDLARNHVLWNEALTDAYGHAPETVEPTGAWWLGHIHPDDRARIDASIHAVIDGTGNAWLDSYRFLRADGSYADVVDRGYVIRGADGRATRMIGAMLDLTEQKRVEAALRRLNETLEAQVRERTRDRNALWQLSTDIMLRSTFAGVIAAVNPAWTEVLGWHEDELIGASLFDLVHPDDLARTRETAQQVSEGITHARFDNRYRHKAGGYRWISWAARPGDGLINAVGRDFTVEREREEALRQAEEALRQSQKMEAVGQLTGGVAHDFNNLLTIIRSSVDFLRRPELPEARKTRYLDAVSDTVDRAAKLTGQLLAFARRQALKPEVFEVGARLRGVADLIDTVTGARIQVATDLPDVLCHVRCDVSQFETALVNMAVNARDAMEGQGVLTLRLVCGSPMPAIRGHAGSRSAFAAVSISDTGTGIPPDLLGRIFEPFFTTKEVGKGTGLGLSQVFGFAKQSGGDVDVQSTLGAGTRFTLYLPEVAGRAGPEEAEPDPLGAPVGSGQRVLVVEDNVEVGRFSTQILQDLGYETTWAANAEEALDRIGADGGGFDVVFSDVVMPGMGGIALAEELRRRLPDLPVVLASGYSHVLAEQSEHGFELLHKPYAAEQLSRVLRRVTARAGRRRRPDG